MRSKIITLAITIMMICMGFSMMAFTVPAEDVIAPFVERNDGFPIASELLDVNQPASAAQFTLTSAAWRSQSFRPTVNGELTKISLEIWLNGGAGNVFFELYQTNQAEMPFAGSSIAIQTVPSGNIPGGGPTWFDVSFPTAPVLNAGTEYAIVVHPDPACSIYWRYWSANVYGDGGVAFSNDGNGMSWTVNPTVEMSFQTYMTPPALGISKIAWHSNGDYAFGVTGEDSKVYRYTRNTGAWSLFDEPNTDVVFHDIVFSEDIGYFFMVGGHVSGGSAGYPAAYYHNGVSILAYPNPTTQGMFYGVEKTEGIGGCFLVAVGEDLTGNGYAAWRTGFSWIDMTTGWQVHDEQLRDVAWNLRTDGTANFYAIGEDEFADGLIYDIGYPGDTNVNLLHVGGTLGPLNAIEWNPDWGSGNDWAITAGDSVGFGNIWKFDGVDITSLYDSNTEYFYDLDFFPNGPHMGTCQIVGEGESTTGIMGTINPAATKIAVDTISADPCKAIALKGPSSPSSGIIATASGGISFYPDAWNQDTTITANAIFPKLYWIGFNETDGTDRGDQPVAVNDWYDFTLVANYSQGWANCEIEVKAWYDWGQAGDTSVYPAETVDNRNLAFTLLHVVGGATTIQYPLAGTEINTALATDNIWWVNPDDAAQSHHHLEIPIYLGPQIRNASAGNFLSGDDYDADPNNALLDQWSWDFNITVRDRFNPTAKSTSHGEFGVQKAVSVLATGNPTGNAPPGSVGTPLLNPSLITYSANADYWVNVSIPHLYENGNDLSPNWIPASSVNVSNVNVLSDSTYSDIDGNTCPEGRPMLGEDADWCVWGNSTTSTWTPAPCNGTTAFGEFGSDYNAVGLGNAPGTTELNWWIAIPATTPEGVYWGAITITIDSGG
ncbi:MAG: hypothetical protein KAJ64_00290 [Thermoplasmata archaeon]|nr:hypothetical protein [Thermoplasmata archaeon]